VSIRPCWFGLTPKSPTHRRTVADMTDSMDSPAAIMGQFSGGPLDGLSFSLPASSGLVGATLVVLLRDRDEHGEARKHAYQLVPLDLTNEMQYHGELG
jgi:hypothetical protein